MIPQDSDADVAALSTDLLDPPKERPPVSLNRSEETEVRRNDG
jgi:hypothetical protein